MYVYMYVCINYAYQFFLTAIATYMVTLHMERHTFRGSPMAF